MTENRDRKSRPKRSEPRGDYDVGFGRPPKEHQFKPGQSGNPKGRPRRATRRKPVLQRLFENRVKITRNGKVETVSAEEAVLLKLLEKAIKGDARAIDQVLRLRPEVAREIEDIERLEREFREMERESDGDKIMKMVRCIVDPDVEFDIAKDLGFETTDAVGVEGPKGDQDNDFDDGP